jgi:hypothetical protein
VKVGDLVVQGTRVMKMMKGGKPMLPSMRVGIVLAVHEHPQPIPEKVSGWMKHIGRPIDVLWSNGKRTKNFAENGLEVISAAAD